MSATPKPDITEAEKARSATIRRLMGEGISRQDANLMIDLSMHALAEMESAMQRVCDTAPHSIRLHVVANVMTGIKERMEMGLQMLTAFGIQMKDLSI